MCHNDQNTELRESYDRDVVVARKAASNLEARLAAERSASAVVDMRMKTLTEEARQARDRLYELEASATTLEEQVSLHELGISDESLSGRTDRDRVYHCSANGSPLSQCR